MMAQHLQRIHMNTKTKRSSTTVKKLTAFLLTAAVLAMVSSMITFASAAGEEPSTPLTYIAKGSGFDCFSEKANWSHDDDWIVQTIGTPTEEPNAREILKTRRIQNCITGNNYGMSHVLGFGIVMGMLPGALIFILLPFICVGRYCCKIFGSNLRRPSTFCWGGAEDDQLDEREKQKLYLPAVQNRWRGLVVVILIVGTGFAAIMIVGKNLTLYAYDDWQDGINANVKNMMSLTQVDEYLHFPVNDTYAAPFDSRSANDALGTNPSYLGDYYLNEANTYFTPTEYNLLLTITNAWAVAPVLGFLFLFTLCVFDIRKILPLLAILFIAAVGVGGSAGVFFGFRILGSFQMMCEEVEIYKRGPSDALYDQNVGTQRLIPQCRTILTSTNNFRITLQQRKVHYAQNACDLLYSICVEDDSTPYDPSTDGIKQLVCPDMPSTLSANSCSSWEDVDDFYSNTYSRAGSDGSGGQFAACGPTSTSCDRQVCATACPDGVVKSRAYESIQATEMAENLEYALAAVLDDPCVELIDGLANSFKSCNVGTVGLQLLLGALVCNNLLCMFAIIVALRGQKLFFKRLKGRRKRRKALDDEEDSTGLMTTTLGDGTMFDETMTSGEAATKSFKQTMARLRSNKRAGSYSSQNKYAGGGDTSSIGRGTTLAFGSEPIADDVIMIDSDGDTGTATHPHGDNASDDDDDSSDEETTNKNNKSRTVSNEPTSASAPALGAGGKSPARPLGLPPLANGAPSKPSVAPLTAAQRAASRSPAGFGGRGTSPNAQQRSRDSGYDASEMVFIDEESDSGESYESSSDDREESAIIANASGAVSEAEDGVTSPF